MKRFVFILAMLLIGFAGMAAEKADYTQSNAPPGDACFNLVIENSQVAVVNAQVDVVVIYHFFRGRLSCHCLRSFTGRIAC